MSACPDDGVRFLLAESAGDDFGVVAEIHLGRQGGADGCLGAGWRLEDGGGRGR